MLRILGLLLNDGLWVKTISWDFGVFQPSGVSLYNSNTKPAKNIKKYDVKAKKIWMEYKKYIDDKWIMGSLPLCCLCLCFSRCLCVSLCLCHWLGDSFQTSAFSYSGQFSTQLSTLRDDSKWKCICKIMIRKYILFNCSFGEKILSV